MKICLISPVVFVELYSLFYVQTENDERSDAVLYEQPQFQSSSKTIQAFKRVAATQTLLIAELKQTSSEVQVPGQRVENVHLFVEMTRRGKGRLDRPTEITSFKYH
ncbi:hypothetical protein M0804_002123 [Polistes exclamans]|nr:hypothetical protein M0804_002123 [Polistes exclamans]